MMQPDLETPRLRLSRPTADLAPAIAALANDFGLVRQTGRMPYPYGLEDARRFLEEVVPAEVSWAVFERESGAFCGCIGFTGPKDGEAEFGYWLGRPFWGRGLASEAGAAALAYGLGPLGLTRVRACVFSDNPASMRVLEKLKFKSVGDCVGLSRATGEERALRRFERLREEGGR